MVEAIRKAACEMPQIYLAVFVFLVLLACYISIAISMGETGVTIKLGSMLEALFWALIGGFALGQRPERQGAQTTIHARSAPISAEVTGPITVEDNSDAERQPSRSRE